MPGLHKKPKKYVSDAQRKAVHASKEDGGKGNPNKPKMKKTNSQKIGKLKKKKTKEMKLSRGITASINLGGGKALVGLDLSGHRLASPTANNPYQKSLDKGKKKPNAKFPDLSGDGKVTKKDILIGRGVIDKPKMLRKKRKNYV